MSKYKNVPTIGIASIKVADTIAGAMQTELSKYESLGDTTEGSVKFTQEDGNTTEFKVEEYDTPLHVEKSAGKSTITWQLAAPSLQAMEAVFGGKINGDVYEAPSQVVTLEKSLEITSRKGFSLKFPRVSITAKFTGDLGKANLLGLEIVATVLKSTKDTEPLMYVYDATKAQTVGGAQVTPRK